MYLEKQLPLRVICIVTLFASTFDILADSLMGYRIFGRLDDCFPRYPAQARRAAYVYLFFVVISFVVYVFEMADVFLTLKNDEENRYVSRWAKSLVVVFEEVPLPLCLCLIFVRSQDKGLANPMMLAGSIKVIALLWGIVKFSNLRFFWCCVPCMSNHGFEENTRRCFTPTLYRIAMFFVSACIIAGIIISFNNVVLASGGGNPTEDCITRNEPITKRSVFWMM